MMDTEVFVKSSRYGKEQVKFLKKIVDRDDPARHTVIEYTVLILLRGAFDVSYTHGDNSVVIPTDTMKNSVYLLAKTHEFEEPEVFAAIVANYFVSFDKFAHVSSADCTVRQHRWTRIVTADGLSHPHSFYRDGAELRLARCEAFRDSGHLHISSGIEDLLVLKSTGSAFNGFWRDEWTTLPDVADRIFSTQVSLTFRWAPFNTFNQVLQYAPTFLQANTHARQTTLDTFATDNSASVQATLFKMCEAIIARFCGISECEYTLPNKHYFEVNMQPFAIDNSGRAATIYMPQAWPAGHINACIARRGQSTL
ncbi:hypothetical protein PYCC9005_001889 [Savitreella phatthalungensis]